ncbi:MAG: archaeoflavoprotein AfpA [Candidatus Lokiarchaeota archaeon]|nr:archaeoflavoprotein AfpA [Candidatus Lokiarchaeota archaeon]
MSPFRIMWGITGTGYLIKESIDLMKDLIESHDVEITVMLSKEGEVVVKWYKQWDYLNEVVEKVRTEKTPNNPFLAGPLQIGKYDMFIVCPVSANSVAKIVYGIADTLVTNCVAQTIKGGIDVHLLPSDQHLEPIVTSKPDGSPLILKIRDIEIENVDRLKKMEGIHVFAEFSEIKNAVLKEINKK